MPLTDNQPTQRDEDKDPSPKQLITMTQITKASSTARQKRINIARKDITKQTVANMQAKKESETVQQALNIMQCSFDPEEDVELVNYMTTEPTHDTIPLFEKEINFTNDFVVETTPNIFGGIFMTDDRRRLDDSPVCFYGSRDFTESLYVSAADSVSPAGRYESDIKFNMPYLTAVQMELLTTRGEAKTTGYYTPNGWAFNFGSITAGPGTRPFVMTVTSGLPDNISQNLELTYELGGTDVLTVSLPPATSGQFGTRYVHTLPSGPSLVFDKVTYSIAEPNPSDGPTFVTSILMAVCGAEMEPTNRVLWNQVIPMSANVENVGDRLTVLSMTTWVQFRGSSLVNGGSIAGHRFPKGYIPDRALSEYYPMITSVPRHYKGALKEGAFGFYQPGDLTDLQMREIHSQVNGPRMIIAGSNNVEDGVSVVLSVRMRVRITTTDPLFQPRFRCNNPDAHSLAMTFLQHLRPVCCNPKHVERLRKAIAIVKKYFPKIKNGTMHALQVAEIVGPALAALV
jgi:hypothetical protein